MPFDCLVDYKNANRYTVKVTTEDQVQDYVDLYSRDSDVYFEQHKHIPGIPDIKPSKVANAVEDSEGQDLKLKQAIVSAKPPAAAKVDAVNQYTDFKLSDEEDEGYDMVDYVAEDEEMTGHEAKTSTAAPAQIPVAPKAPAPVPVKTEKMTPIAPAAATVATATASGQATSVAQQFKSAVFEKAVKEISKVRDIKENGELVAVAVAANVDKHREVKEAAKTLKKKVMTLDDLIVECEALHCWAAREQARKIKTFCDLVGFQPTAKFTEGPFYGCTVVADVNGLDKIEFEEVFGDTQVEAIESALQNFTALILTGYGRDGDFEDD